MKAARVATVVAFSVIALAVAPAGPAPLAAPQLSLLSVEDEIELGKQAQTEVRQQVPSVDDRQVSRYLDGVFRQLARRAGRTEYPYSISVANYAEVNAFALPGGPVWIHRGTLEAAGNEAQLAGVLGHEIAHISLRHVAQQVTQHTVAGGLLALLGQVLPEGRKGEIGRMAAGLAAQGMMLKFSRDDEREADREGMRIMQAAGWDPRGLPEFLELLGQQQGRNPSSVEIFLSNHPAPGERAEALRAGGLPNTGRRDTAAFRNMRSRLKAMPPAPKMERR